MRFRISDGHSHAEEWECSGEAGFKAGLSKSIMCFRAHIGSDTKKLRATRFELQVYDSELGHWCSANYPHSNSPLYVTAKDDIYNQAEYALHASNWFGRGIKQMKEFQTAETKTKPEFKLV